MASHARALPPGPYVVLGGPPFEPSANQTSMQMFNAIGAGEPILYVCRRYQGSIIRRLMKGSLGKTTTALRPGLHGLDDNRHLLVLPRIADFLPMTFPEPSRKVMQLIVKASVTKALTKLGWRNPILIAYWWMFPEFVSMRMWRFRVFDIIDRHWGYAYERSSRINERNFALAVETAQAVDEVKSVSESLVKELAEHAVVNLLPNAIDLSRVDAALAEVKQLIRPKIAAYAGGWNERLNVDLLLELVRRNPDWSFIFLGASNDLRFEQFPNVKFFGDLPYHEVISHLSTARIGLVPFVSNAYTESSNFLKILDYLATDLIVGATSLESLGVWAERYPSHFKIIDTLEDWDLLFKHAGNLERDRKSGQGLVDMSQYGTLNRALSLVTRTDHVVSGNRNRSSEEVERVNLD